MVSEEEASQFSEVDIYVPAEDVRDSEMARISAWSDVQASQGARAPIYLKVSSVQWNRSRGGWTVCFKRRDEPRAILRKKEEVTRQLRFYEDFIKKNQGHPQMDSAVDAIKQRVWTLQWVLSQRDSF